MRAVRRLQALAEHLDPARLAHPPELVARDDVVRVEQEPAPREAVGHVLREPGEVAVDLRIVGRRVRESRLNVRAERELAPRDAAEREPGPGRRRLAAPCDREVDQPCRDRVDLQREHSAHVDRREVRI